MYDRGPGQLALDAVFPARQDQLTTNRCLWTMPTGGETSKGGCQSTLRLFDPARIVNAADAVAKLSSSDQTQVPPTQERVGGDFDSRIDCFRLLPEIRAESPPVSRMAEESSSARFTCLWALAVLDRGGRHRGLLHEPNPDRRDNKRMKPTRSTAKKTAMSAIAVMPTCSPALNSRCSPAHWPTDRVLMASQSEFSKLLFTQGVSLGIRRLRRLGNHFASRVSVSCVALPKTVAHGKKRPLPHQTMNNSATRWGRSN